MMSGWLVDLQGYVEDAKFDSAVALLEGNALDDRLREIKPDSLELVRGAGLICEVRDYASHYSKARNANQYVGKQALDRIKALAQWRGPSLPYSEEECHYLKAQCWACLHRGMTHHRSHAYSFAKDVFEVARNALVRIDEKVPCSGSLARAHYCLGLVARQEHDYDRARKYFSDSVELGWKKLKNMRSDERGRKGVLYNIGRALGLGMAYVAYTQSALSEANAHIVAARLLLADKEVKYIRAYVDIVHACTQMSAHGDDIEAVGDALNDLQATYKVLGGDQAIESSDDEGFSPRGHAVYALRAANELASGYLRRARLHRGSQKGEQGLQETLCYIQRVKDCKAAAKLERRTFCNACILESRVYREKYATQGRDPVNQTAVENAVREATESGSDLGFSRIDCWIERGEAAYLFQQYTEAIKAFSNAQAEPFALTNPKVIAVCNLHLARCHLANSDFSSAQECFASWEKSGLSTRANAFIRELAAEVRDWLRRGGAPFVAKPDVQLSPDRTAELQLDFYKWLGDTAMLQANGNVEAAARRLGIAPRSLRAWRKRETTRGRSA